jgi:hypothetical protein
VTCLLSPGKPLDAKSPHASNVSHSGAGNVSYRAATRRQLLPFQKPDRPVPVPFVDPDGPAWPTATQSLADRQVTPANELALPLPGAGTLVTVQAAPFQDTAAALLVLTPVRYDSMVPTATHRFTAAQETPESSEPPGPPSGNGMAGTCQFLPFQISLKLPVAMACHTVPTAAQLPAEAQETPVSPAARLGGGAAGFIADQVLPFHDSITATGGPETGTPTATQRAGDAHETASRPLIGRPPAAAGSLASAHVFPFQISASGAGT